MRELLKTKIKICLLLFLIVLSFIISCLLIIFTYENYKDKVIMARVINSIIIVSLILTLFVAFMAIIELYFKIK
jgi:hypothetical protein